MQLLSAVKIIKVNGHLKLDGKKKEHPLMITHCFEELYPEMSTTEYSCFD